MESQHTLYTSSPKTVSHDGSTKTLDPPEQQAHHTSCDPQAEREQHSAHPHIHTYKHLLYLPSKISQERIKSHVVCVPNNFLWTFFYVVLGFFFQVHEPKRLFIFAAYVRVSILPTGNRNVPGWAKRSKSDFLFLCVDKTLLCTSMMQNIFEVLLCLIFPAHFF